MKEPWNYRSESECLTGLADNLYGKDDGKFFSVIILNNKNQKFNIFIINK